MSISTGKYQVRYKSQFKRKWAVVNIVTGDMVGNFIDEDQAIKYAAKLNGEA